MVGTDKVVLNTAVLTQGTLTGDVARAFGSQCIVVSIDLRRAEDGSTEVYSHSGNRATGRDPFEWAREAEQEGAG